MTNTLVDTPKDAAVASRENAGGRADRTPEVPSAELSSRLSALVGLVGILLAALIVFIAAEGTYDVYDIGGLVISQRFFVFCAFILLCLATCASLFCMGARSKKEQRRAYSFAFGLTAASLPLTFLAVIFSI